jgi:5-methylcytosine-specific restriction endonuclease McrBC GTP-binding regulatory subunit McrB
LKNYEDSQKPIEVIKQEKGLEELFEGFKDSVSEYLEQNKDGVYPITDAVNIVEVKTDAFVYLGHNWNRNTRGIQMKFKDIILIYNNENAKDRQSALLTPEISGLAKNHISWYFKMVNEFKKFVKNHKGNIVKSDKKIELKNYVIIIDEINRANISRVFGELITLIEDDKRWGNDHAMEVRLPDGLTKFTVPKNLFIIGTMNTADKSIALLDIALRRRFEFTALYPDSQLVNEKYKGFFEALNKDIIAKKGIDFTIGHSYFMTKNGEELDFVNTMNKKVIPLLCEYFYNIKDNKVVVKLVEDAITKASLTHKIIPNDYQIFIR